MLMLQQKVRILAEPYLGEEHFDDDRIGQVTNIMSLILRDDDVLYQLEEHDSECLWREDELGAGDCMLAIEPRFNLGDEVLIRRYVLWNTHETIPYAYVRYDHEVKPVNTYTLF